MKRCVVSLLLERKAWRLGTERQAGTLRHQIGVLAPEHAMERHPVDKRGQPLGVGPVTDIAARRVGSARVRITASTVFIYIMPIH